MKNNFSVGPARLYHGVSGHIKNSLDDGLGSLGHRSPEWSTMSEKTIQSLRLFFGIPSDYKIYYTYSATMALELSVRSCVENAVHHIVNGNFGKVWRTQSEHHAKNCTSQEAVDDIRISVPEILPPENAEMLCVTANETARGIAYSHEEIEMIRKLFPEKLLAIDCTSTMGALAHEFSMADIWCFSVQKALGIPPGLGILVMSPRAYEKAISRDAQNNGDTGGHHCISQLEKKMGAPMPKGLQTPTTPNSLGISALGFVAEKLQQNFGSIKKLDELTQQKAQKIYDFFDAHHMFSPSISLANGRSLTSIIITGTDEHITSQKEKLAQHGIIVGSGYGQYKSREIRIGNFPVQSMEDIDELLSLF